jgi:hypothetical protein
MKSKALYLLILLLLGACGGSLEYRYYTKINDDGSVDKKIVAVGDSTSIYGKPFSFDTSKGWKMSYGIEVDKEDGDTLHLAIAEKTFLSAENQNQDLYINKDSTHFDNILVDYNKSFRWFFTFHDYGETFHQRFPYRHLDVNEFLNDQELAYFFENDTTVINSMTKEEINALDTEGEERYYKFIITSCAVEYIRLLNQYAVGKGIELLDRQDSVKVMQLFDSYGDDGIDVANLGSELQVYLDLSWPAVAYEQGYLKDFESQIDNDLILLDEHNYKVVVDVPGLLYSTNAEIVDENITRWQFNRGRFLYKDFRLFVKYRTTNYWAIILTVLFVGTFVVYFYRQRNTN